MKTTTHRALTAVIALLFTAGLCSAQTRTVPIGYMTYPVTNGATISFGVPLVKPPIFTGFASTVNPASITVTGGSWTANQFITPGKHYFVLIKTGLQAGRTLLVVGNTADTLTLDVEDTNLNAAGFAVVAGTDAFELFEGNSLGSLFGTTADASGILTSGLKGGTASSNADGVQVYNGTSFATYFFNTTLGYWVLVNGGTTNRNDFILYPDDGMLLTRRGVTGSITMSGRVPANKLLTKFAGGSTNVVTVRFPVGTTLGGLNFGSPGTWLSGSSSSVADTVGLWNGSRWILYYKNTSNRWVRNNGGSTDQGAVAIPAGRAIQVLKRGTATGATSFFSQPLPYGL